jgi:hypothetical protein
MRAATYAFTIGRGRDFTAQAFRDALQRGRDLSRAAHGLDVGRAVGLYPAGLETAIADRARPGSTTAFAAHSKISYS